jgi:hypothetical protein
MYLKKKLTSLFYMIIAWYDKLCLEKTFYAVQR